MNQPPTISLVKPTIVPQDFISLWRRNMISGHNMKSARRLAIAQFAEQFPDIVLDTGQIPRNIAECINPDDAARLTSDDAMIQSLMEDELAFSDFIIPQVANAGSIDAVIEVLNLSADTVGQVHTTYRKIIAGDSSSNDTSKTSDQPEGEECQAGECDEDDDSCISEEDQEDEKHQPVDNGAEKQAAMQAEYEELAAKWLRKNGDFIAKASHKVRQRIIELREVLEVRV